MTRKIITMLLVITCLVGTFAGCSVSSSNNNETKEAVTTKKAEVTTTEARTEEPTTKYVYKGEKYGIDPMFKEYFLAHSKLNPGDKIYINDIIPESYADGFRGGLTLDIVSFIYYYYNEKYAEFEEKYREIGSAECIISYAENLYIEYEGDKTVVFDFVEDGEKSAIFDTYLID